MRIGFFGGSFDPPHLGHRNVARAAAAAFRLERVLLAPTARQPLKPDGPVASYDDRLEMVRLLCEGVDGLEGSALDAPTTDGQPNFTVDTLTRLRSGIASEDEVFVIVGADAFLELRRWRSPDQLFNLAAWIVVTRPGTSLEQIDALRLSQAQRQRVHLLGGIAEEVSATTIREALREHRDCSGLLPASILDYIVSHHLYGT